MEISDILSRVVILVFPGIVCNLVYGILRDKPTKKDWEDFLQILIFSVLSYAIFDLFIAMMRFIQTKSFSYDFSSLAPFIDNSISIEWAVVLFVSIIGALLGVVAAYFYKYRWFTKFGLKIGATRIYSEEDVWTDFFDEAHNEWVIVRDYKRDLTYLGWVKNYSHNEKERELTLGDVSFYDGTKEELDEPLYSRDSVYVSLSKSECSIELMEQDEQDNGDSKMDNEKDASDTQIKKTAVPKPKTDSDAKKSKQGKKPSKPKPKPKKSS